MKMNAVSLHTAKSIIKKQLGFSFTKNIIPKNMMLTGSPGVGKSSIIKQACAELEQELGIIIMVHDVRLSCMSYSDVQGVPHNVESGEFIEVEGIKIPKKVLVHSTPEWFPVNNDDGVYHVLFFDELTNALPSTQHAAYRILLDRDLQNGERLSDRCAIIGAGNLMSDKTGAKPLMAAAANRFAVHLEVDVKLIVKEVAEHFIEQGIDRRIVGFLNWKPDALYSGYEVGDDAFATPRTWEDIDSHLALYSGNELDIVVAGCIGTGTAVSFLGYCEYADSLPDFKLIRSGKLDYTYPSGNEELKWASVTGVTYEIIDILGQDYEDEQYQEEMDNMIKVVDSLPKEMQIVLFQWINKQPKLSPRILKYKGLRRIFGEISKIAQGLK